MIITLASVRGSPGVTSWSLLLAAAWPSDVAVERAVLEADVAGGIMGARYGWGVDPGVVDLIAHLRRRDGRTFSVADAGRLIADGVWAVPAPEDGDRLRRTWREEAAQLADRLAADPRVWLVDAGRVDASSPCLPFVSSSAMFVLVAGGRPDELVSVRQRLAALLPHCAAQGLLVTGSCAHSEDELREFSRVIDLWRTGPSRNLPEAVVLALDDTRARRRSTEWRRALEIAADLARVTATAGDRMPESSTAVCAR